jgi:hypothetical protein
MRESVDESARERFFREARCGERQPSERLPALRHRRHGRSPFLVMELLDGQSLGDRLREGVLPLTDAMQIAWAR